LEQNTSEAESFSIVTEEAVQQGVRRIEAVTGSQARIATENAVRLEKLLALLKTTPVDKLQASFLTYRKDFEATSIPMHKRIDIRKELHDIEQKIKAAAKKKHVEKLHDTASVVESIQQSLRADETLIVFTLLMDVGDNNKILSDTAAAVVEDAKKTLSRDVAVFLASKDASSKKPKTLLVANVPPALISRGLKANEWVSAVASGLGGKGGGAPTGNVAQGNILDPNVAETAVESARVYASSKLN